MTPEKLATDVEAPIIQTWSALDHPTSSPFFLSLSLSFFFPWVIIIADPHHGTRRNKTERHPSRWRASERPIKVKSRAWDVWRTGHYVQRYRRWFSFHSFPCGVVTCQRVQQHKKMWIVSSLSARRDDVNHKPRIPNLIFFFISEKFGSPWWFLIDLEKNVIAIRRCPSLWCRADTCKFTECAVIPTDTTTAPHSTKE